MSGPRLVSGRVRLVDPLDTRAGMLHVRVADVSRVDAPSRVVAEQAIPVHDALAAGAELPFTLVVPQVEDGASYIVQVHLDTTGSAMVTPGDRISMAAYPVLTGGHPDDVTVEARTV